MTKPFLCKQHFECGVCGKKEQFRGIIKDFPVWSPMPGIQSHAPIPSPRGWIPTVMHWQLKMSGWIFMLVVPICSAECLHRMQGSVAPEKLAGLMSRIAALTTTDELRYPFAQKTGPAPPAPGERLKCTCTKEQPDEACPVGQAIGNHEPGTLWP